MMEKKKIVTRKVDCCGTCKFAKETNPWEYDGTSFCTIHEEEVWDCLICYVFMKKEED